MTNENDETGQAIEMAAISLGVFETGGAPPRAPASIPVARRSDPGAANRQWREQRDRQNDRLYREVAPVLFAVFEITSDELFSKSHGQRVARARNALCLSFALSGARFCAIGRLVDRDHTTVMSAIRRALALVRTDAAYRMQFWRFIQGLGRRAEKFQLRISEPEFARVFDAPLPSIPCKPAMAKRSKPAFNADARVLLDALEEAGLATPTEILGREQRHRIARARALFVHALTHRGYSTAMIAECLERDHTTILAMRLRALKHGRTNKAFRADRDRLWAVLGEAAARYGIEPLSHDAATENSESEDASSEPGDDAEVDSEDDAADDEAGR